MFYGFEIWWAKFECCTSFISTQDYAEATVLEMDIPVIHLAP